MGLERYLSCKSSWRLAFAARDAVPRCSRVRSPDTLHRETLVLKLAGLDVGSVESRESEDPADDQGGLGEARVSLTAVARHAADAGSWVGADSYVVLREVVVLLEGMLREADVLELVPMPAVMGVANVETMEAGCHAIQGESDLMGDSCSYLRRRLQRLRV